MIPTGHRHRFDPFAATSRPDGLRDVQTRCVCGPGVTIEQHLVVDVGGRVVDARLRYNGIWVRPLDLLRATAALGMRECPTCAGVPPIPGASGCGTCAGTGVLMDDGTPLSAPPIFTRA